MAKNKRAARLRPTGEDRARAVAYVYLLVWSVVYFIYPPTSSLVAVDWLLRGIWMSFTAIAAVMCIIGSVRRIDLKLELPGLLLAILATSTFAFTQLYFAVAADPAFGTPSSRYALVVYACLPPLLFLSRALGLLSEARRLRKINQDAVQAAVVANRLLSTGSVRTEVGGQK